MLWYIVHSIVYTCDLILARIWLLGLCPFINRGLVRERKGHAGKREGVAAGWCGLLGRVVWERNRVGFGFDFFFSFPSSFLFLFSSYFQHYSNYLNSNSNLNSTLALKQKEQCTSMNATTNFKPRENFNCLWNKIRLNARLNIINLRKLNKAIKFIINCWNLN